MSPRLLVFDLDDTLYPEHAFVRGGFAAAGAWLAERGLMANFAARANARFTAGQRGTIFNDVLAEAGLDAALVPELLAIYRQHRPQLALHADAAWALAHFAPAYGFALITDGYAQVQRNKVAALGIAAQFHPLIYSDDFGRDGWKPSPLPYRAVMQQSGRQGAECVYIADNPAKDFITARALGWQTVHIRRADGEYAAVEAKPGYAADRQIASLHELAAFYPV